MHTQHHYIQKYFPEGEPIKGHRSAVFYGPSPTNRSDDPGNKGNDIPTQINPQGKHNPTKEAEKAIKASKKPTHVTKQGLKKASTLRRAEKLIANSLRGWLKQKSPDGEMKYQKKPLDSCDDKIPLKNLVAMVKSMFKNNAN